MKINYDEISWQASRDSQKKFNIIEPTLKDNKVSSVLDVGCNAGEITRLAGKSGYFAVGIDKATDFRGFKLPLLAACIGNIELTVNNIHKLPLFDAILFLSVHHQLIASKGDSYAKQFLKLLAERTNIVIIEFAALNRKYNYSPNASFIDNDENSIINYAFKWLKQSSSDFEARYIGKAPNTIIEPYRYIFACVKN